MKNLRELSTTYPIAFTYGNAPFDAAAWNPATTAADTIRYTSPDGRLAVTVTYRNYPEFNATELIPVLECLGDTETPSWRISAASASCAPTPNGKSASGARPAPRQN